MGRCCDRDESSAPGSVMTREGGRRWAGGRLRKEGIDVCTELIRVVVQQKRTHHCKEVMLKLKN